MKRQIVVSSVLGVLTHYYFLSYYNYSKQESIHTKKQCPECKHNIFDEDHRKMEVCCRTCGLVLVAPPHHSFEPAGFYSCPAQRRLRVHSKVREKWWVVSYHL